MKTFFALLAIYAGNSPVTGEFSTQRPVTRSFVSLICAWINGWVNNREAGDLRRHRVHHDITIIDATIYINIGIYWYIVKLWLTNQNFLESFILTTIKKHTFNNPKLTWMRRSASSVQYEKTLCWKYKRPVAIKLWWNKMGVVYGLYWLVCGLHWLEYGLYWKAGPL